MRSAVVLLLAVLLCALLSAPAAALPSSWTEDFTTSLLRNATATTADWDTVSGRLHLWPLPIDQRGAFDTPGTAYDVVLAGDLAYVADYDYGLRIISLADPAAPVAVGAYDSPGTATDVSLHLPYAFLSDGGGGVRIVDVADPAAPVSAGVLVSAGYVNEVAVQGNVAAVAIGALGVQFIDITNPAAPVNLGAYDTPGYAYALEYVGRYVYVADGTSGVIVIDALNPAAPAQVGAYDTAGTAYDVLVAGGRAYVADYGRGVVILGLASPVAPALLGAYDTPGLARGLALDGSFLQVADSGSGVEVLDVTNPAAPQLVQSWDTPGQAYDLAIGAELTVVADGPDGLQVLRHRRLTEQPFVRLQGVEASYQMMTDMVVDGRLAYLTGYGGTLIRDVSDPEFPGPVGSLPIGGEALDVAGTLACVVTSEEGLFVIDVGDPAHPAELANLALPTGAQDVVIRDRYAYVACGSAGLQVVDLTVPTAPALVGSLGFTGNCMSLEVVGDRAFVAAQHGGLRVVDVTDPLHPALLGSFPGAGNVVDVAVAGGYAYVVEFYADIVRKLDVSDPTNIVEAGAVPMSRPRRIAVSGHLAAVVTGNTELNLIEIGDNPGFGSLLEQQSGLSPYCVAFCGDHLLTGDAEYSPYAPYEFAQRWRDPDRNVGAGFLGETGAGYAIKARLKTVQWNGWTFSWMFDHVLDWTLVYNLGYAEQPLQFNGDWVTLDPPAWSLGWRAEFRYTNGREGPYVDSLTLEILRDVPVIGSVTDVPGDQGGQVRLRWIRSAYDEPESDYPLSGYSVYRQVAAPVAGKAGAPAAAVDPQGGADKAWPPGEWDYLLTVPADGEESYSVVVPTLADSTAGAANRAVFFVRARGLEPGVLFDAPPDSGCSVDNLAPPSPRGLMVSYTGGGNLLAWGPPDALDVARYRVYRGGTNGFVPAPANLLAETTSTAWIDRPTAPWDWFYKVAAVDLAGNEGPAAAPAAVTGAPDPQAGGAPARFALRAATPNPFNPRTTIGYDVPASGGEVRLELYDARGRLVRTLVNGHRDAGRQEAVWDGRDDAGRRLPSGVYFARLRAAGCDAVVKLTLAG